MATRPVFSPTINSRQTGMNNTLTSTIRSRASEFHSSFMQPMSPFGKESSRMSEQKVAFLPKVSFHHPSSRSPQSMGQHMPVLSRNI